MPPRRRRSPGALLEIEGLDAFYGRAQALEGVSFSMGTEAVAVIGRNGMGKTTLCNAIMGMLRRVRAARSASTVRSSLGKPSYKIAGRASRTSRRAGGCSSRCRRTST